jgi:hypothetical protein
MARPKAAARKKQPLSSDKRKSANQDPSDSESSPAANKKSKHSDPDKSTNGRVLLKLPPVPEADRRSPHDLDTFRPMIHPTNRDGETGLSHLQNFEANMRKDLGEDNEGENEIIFSSAQISRAIQIHKHYSTPTILKYFTEKGGFAGSCGFPLKEFTRMGLRFERILAEILEIEDPDLLDPRDMTTHKSAVLRLNPKASTTRIHGSHDGDGYGVDNAKFTEETTELLHQMVYRHDLPESIQERMKDAQSTALSQNTTTLKHMLHGDKTRPAKFTDVKIIVPTKTDPEKTTTIKIPVNFSAANPQSVQDLSQRPHFVCQDMYNRKKWQSGNDRGQDIHKAIYDIHGHTKRASTFDLCQLMNMHDFVLRVRGMKRRNPSRFTEAMISPARYVLYEMVHYNWEYDKAIATRFAGLLKDRWAEIGNVFIPSASYHALKLIQILEDAAGLMEEYPSTRLTYPKHHTDPSYPFNHGRIHPFPLKALEVKELEHGVESFQELWTVTTAARTFVDNESHEWEDEDDGGREKLLAFMKRLRDVWLISQLLCYRDDTWLWEDFAESDEFYKPEVVRLKPKSEADDDHDTGTADATNQPVDLTLTSTPTEPESAIADVDMPDDTIQPEASALAPMHTDPESTNADADMTDAPASPATSESGSEGVKTEAISSSVQEIQALVPTWRAFAILPRWHNIPYLYAMLNDQSDLGLEDLEEDLFVRLDEPIRQVRRAEGDDSSDEDTDSDEDESTADEDDNNE